MEDRVGEVTGDVVAPARTPLAEADMLTYQRRAPTGSRWRHRRTGDVYTVIGFCWLEATAEPAVLYSALEGPAPIWARAAAEFFDARFDPIPRVRT